MTDPTVTVSIAQVFAVLFHNRRQKLTPAQVAVQLGARIPEVDGLMHTIFMADLLHMTHLRVDGDESNRYVWHYGITARARRIVKAVGLDGVTDELIRSEYRDAMAWSPRKKWDAPVPAGASGRPAPACPTPEEV